MLGEIQEIEWLDAHTRRIPTGGGLGIDIAMQRADDLDERCLDFLGKRLDECVDRQVAALDIACGHGGQSLRMAARGAAVTAVDIQDKGKAFTAVVNRRRIGKPPVFIQADMRRLPEDMPGAPYDAIICQRAIHYMPYVEGLATIRKWATLLRPGGRLFLSASGLGSDMGTNYPHRCMAVEKRFACLAPEAAARYDMRPPVCLYDTADLINLLHRAGFGVAETFVSPFGNVKAVAFV